MRALKRPKRVQLARCDLILFGLMLCFEKRSHVPDEALATWGGNSIGLLGMPVDRDRGHEAKKTAFTAPAARARWAWLFLTARFAAMLGLPIDVCAHCAGDAAMFSMERAGWQLLLAGKAALRTGPANH